MVANFRSRSVSDFIEPPMFLHCGQETNRWPFPNLSFAEFSLDIHASDSKFQMLMGEEARER